MIPKSQSCSRRRHSTIVRRKFVMNPSALLSMFLAVLALLMQSTVVPSLGGRVLLQQFDPNQECPYPCYPPPIPGTNDPYAPPIATFYPYGPVPDDGGRFPMDPHAKLALIVFGTACGVAVVAGAAYCLCKKMKGDDAAPAPKS